MPNSRAPICVCYSMIFLNFFQDQRIRIVLKRFGLMVGIFIVALFLAQGLWQLSGKMRTLEDERKKKEQELAALVKERERLESEIAYLQGTGALEREAKSRLNYKRTGEEVVIVVPEEQKQATATGVMPRQSFWERIKNFFTSFSNIRTNSNL